MEFVALFSLIFGAWLANYAEKHRQMRPLLMTLLGVLNLVLVVMGVLVVLAGWLMRASTVPLPTGMPELNVLGTGLALVGTGLAAFLPMVSFVRRGLARWLPIDPHSTVHMLALIYAIYLVGNSAATLPLINALAGDQQLAQQVLGGLSPTDAWITGFGFALLALVGVGLFVRRDVREALERLGIRRLHGRQWVWTVALLIALLGTEMLISNVWERLDPQGFQRVGGLAEALLGAFLSPWGAVTVGLAAGIGEELLFRGALQPRLGLLTTALLFTVAHVQYSLSPALLGIFVIALGLGILRARVNTTACIVVHAAFNFLQVFLASF